MPVDAGDFVEPQAVVGPERVCLAASSDGGLEVAEVSGGALPIEHPDLESVHGATIVNIYRPKLGGDVDPESVHLKLGTERWIPPSSANWTAALAGRAPDCMLVLEPRSESRAQSRIAP